MKQKVTFILTLCGHGLAVHDRERKRARELVYAGNSIFVAAIITR